MCVFYLDAINNTGKGHSNSISTWKNLAGSTDARVFRNITWADDHVRIQKGGYILQALTSSSFTVELVFSLNELSITDPDTVSGYLLSNVQSGGFGLQYNNADTNSFEGNVYLGSTYLYAKVPVTPAINRKYFMAANYDAVNKKFSVSINNKYTNSRSATATYKTSSAPVVLGYNPTSTGGLPTNLQQMIDDYNVYSVRMYTRSLSQEELDQNLLYDKARYNF